MARIGFVSLMEVAQWGGSEPLWAESALRLKAAGHDVRACVKSWGNTIHPKVSELVAAGVSVHFRTTESRSPSLALRALRRLRLAAPAPPSANPWRMPGAHELELVVFSSGSNIVHPYCVEPYSQAGVPHALVCQMAADTWWPTDEERKNYGRTMAEATGVFYVSKANRRLTENQFGIRHPRSFVIANPFPKTVWNGVQWPTEQSPLKLAFVGRLEPAAKGCDILLEVLARPEWKSRPVEVSFFGSGSSAEGVRALSEMLDCKQVTFRGFESDVAKIWREHHALVLPSRYEGLPIAIMEAMLAGRVCIVSDVAGNAELMRDNESGFVATGANVTAFAEAMERAWSARDQWPAIGARARSAALAQLPEDPVGVFIEHLERLIALRAPRS